MSLSVSENDLHSYVDGLLEPEHQQQLTDWLTEHPEQAKKVEAYRRLNQELLACYPLPSSDFIRSHSQSEAATEVAAGTASLGSANKQRPLWLQAAVVAAFTLLGGISGWLLHPQEVASPGLASLDLQQTLAIPARVSHRVYTPEVLHPVEVKREQQQHLLGWLSKRMGQPIKAPDLSQQGFSLLGGRLLPANDGPAAQLMYENPLGQRLTLYVRHASEPSTETAFRRFSSEGLNSFYWVDKGLGYALSGDLDEQQLMQSANAVYHQLGF